MQGAISTMVTALQFWISSFRSGKRTLSCIMTSVLPPGEAARVATNLANASALSFFLLFLCKWQNYSSLELFHELHSHGVVGHSFWFSYFICTLELAND